MGPIAGNWFAVIALVGWPLVALWLYKTQPVARATIWTILAAYLLLPTGSEIKIEKIPAFDKNSIPSFAALLCCLLIVRRPIRFTNGLGLTELLIAIFLISPFITSLLNGDEILNGGIVQPGIDAYEGGSTVIVRFVSLIPFVLGRQLLRDKSSNIEIMRALAIGGLAYSVPMLIEMRMSPQMQNWVYGFFGAGSFAETVRGGGYRPVVFLASGLAVTFFVMTSTVAAAALWRLHMPIHRIPPARITAYFGVILLACRSLGSIVYGLVLVPLVRYATPRAQLRLATALVAIALTYPILRTLDFVPTTVMFDVAKLVSDERADSLETRFINEQALLDRAHERFWFGWGRFGRSLIFNSYGDLINPPDGAWITAMGAFGFVGFLGQFGLLAITVLRARSALTYLTAFQERVLFGTLALIVAINIVNLLPNSSLAPWNWLFAGALLGRAELLRTEVARARVNGPH